MFSQDTNSRYNSGMRVNLDLCCLKRPFDDQTQPRNHAESEAVLAVMTKGLANIEFVQTPALHLENEQNPVFHRANWVLQWLNSQVSIISPDEDLRRRTGELMALGLKNFDAFQVASAELSASEVFVTCDDRLLSIARRNPDKLKTRVTDPLTFASEVLK